MIVTATEPARNSGGILDRVVQSGKVMDVQRHGKIVAVIQPRVGATRSELLRLRHRRDLDTADFKELKPAMDSVAGAIEYAGFG